MEESWEEFRKEWFFSFVDNKEKLLAGMCCPDIPKCLESLRNQNIGAIVTLTRYTHQSHEEIKEFGFKYLHLPIFQDMPPSMEQVETFLKFVYSLNSENRGVVVHCMNGRGRTCTMLMMYIIHQKMGEDFDKCFDILKRRRPKGRGIVRYHQKAFLKAKFEEIYNLKIDTKIPEEQSNDEIKMRLYK